MQARHLNQIELSRRWNVSHRTLERWRSIGEGPAFLTGPRNAPVSLARLLEDAEAA